VDYAGEVGWREHEHRFRGVSDSFSFAVHGPAEQLIAVLNSDLDTLVDAPGLSRMRGGRLEANPAKTWDPGWLDDVDWTNLYRLDAGGLKRVPVRCAQVLQQIGCPYASVSARVNLPYPTNLNDAPFDRSGSVSVELRGCAFCDIARDKGFAGALPWETVLHQVRNLPSDADGRKICFELINEAPFAHLGELLTRADGWDLRLSQINLVGRADWLVRDQVKVREALRLAAKMRVRLLMSSVGFESFSDVVLRNLRKGYPVETNLAAVRLLRDLKEEYPENWFYTPADGANHGFIHPTPWDSAETEQEIKANIERHGLAADILPATSVPLIIHHASGLGDWIRAVEKAEGLALPRAGSVIEWW
jgi:hypothetical protein